MRHLSVPGVVTAEQIGALSDVDAHAMLQYLEPRLLPDDLEELSSLCGNLPLALQVVGGALSANPHLAPSKMAKKLRRGGGGGGGSGAAGGGVMPSPHPGRGLSGELSRTIYGTLRVSYEFLSDGPTGSRATLQQLSVFADTFDLPAAEAVLMMESEEVEDHVNELLVNNMLEKAVAVEGRECYRMRDVVREFAHKRSDLGRDF